MYVLCCDDLIVIVVVETRILSVERDPVSGRRSRPPRDQQLFRPFRGCCRRRHESCVPASTRASTLLRSLTLVGGCCCCCAHNNKDKTAAALEKGRPKDMLTCDPYYGEMGGPGNRESGSGSREREKTTSFGAGLGLEKEIGRKTKRGGMEYQNKETCLS